MDQDNFTQPSETPKTAKAPDVPAPKKRFRIEKIEERIAPGGHYNPQSKLVGVGGGGGGGGSSNSGSSVSSGSIY